MSEYRSKIETGISPNFGSVVNREHFLKEAQRGIDLKVFKEISQSFEVYLGLDSDRFSKFSFTLKGFLVEGFIAKTPPYEFTEIKINSEDARKDMRVFKKVLDEYGRAIKYLALADGLGK
ncbi:MAG: hypothetical protein KBC81_00720 [Candidatus Pacebacteria bacterium]|nr:hypothetical protein [Candidatus Paceibacterota bacterium]